MNGRRRPGQLVLAALLSAQVLNGSCRQVLDIEEAELAPTTAGSRAHSSGGSDDGSPAMAGEGGVPPTDTPSLAGASGDAAAGEGGQPSLCDRYCATVSESCSGALAVYTSLATCQAVCKALPQGQPGAAQGNSVECRLRAALATTNELPHRCSSAGPGGNGVCGSDCESLCRLRASVCAGLATTDEATCARDCAKLESIGSYSTDVKAGQYGGPHVQCRLYHVSAAAAGDAEQHCLHVDGAAPCN